ncbi:Hypothetical protein (Fragment) [Durusdinium trenchii]|uniref:EF-hand domain-containing protein n=1 Tax=Durusdinium trenchii TaxID=1381693 RepID=A0ABP0PMN4_9DINO
MELLRELPMEGSASGVTKLGMPNDVVADAAGNLLVMDTRNERVAVFRQDGTFIASIMEGFFKDKGNTFSYLACNVETGVVALSNNDMHELALLSTDPARLVLIAASSQAIGASPVKMTVMEANTSAALVFQAVRSSQSRNPACRRPTKPEDEVPRRSVRGPTGPARPASSSSPPDGRRCWVVVADLAVAGASNVGMTDIPIRSQVNTSFPRSPRRLGAGPALRRGLAREVYFRGVTDRRVTDLAQEMSRSEDDPSSAQDWVGPGSVRDGEEILRHLAPKWLAENHSAQKLAAEMIESGMDLALLGREDLRELGLSMVEASKVLNWSQVVRSRPPPPEQNLVRLSSDLPLSPWHGAKVKTAKSTPSMSPWAEVEVQAEEQRLDEIEGQVDFWVSCFASGLQCTPMLSTGLESLQEDERVREVFVSMDTDNDGHVSVEELRVGLQRCGISGFDNQTLATVFEHVTGSLSVMDFNASALGRFFMLLVVCFQRYHRGPPGGKVSDAEVTSADRKFTEDWPGGAPQVEVTAGWLPRLQQRLHAARSRLRERRADALLYALVDLCADELVADLRIRGDRSLLDLGEVSLAQLQLAIVARRLRSLQRVVRRASEYQVRARVPGG